jgi:hypothetical protein
LEFAPADWPDNLLIEATEQRLDLSLDVAPGACPFVQNASAFLF